MIEALGSGVVRIILTAAGWLKEEYVWIGVE